MNDHDHRELAALKARARNAEKMVQWSRAAGCPNVADHWRNILATINAEIAALKGRASLASTYLYNVA